MTNLEHMQSALDQILELIEDPIFTIEDNPSTRVPLALITKELFDIVDRLEDLISLS